MLAVCAGRLWGFSDGAHGAPNSLRSDVGVRFLYGCGHMKLLALIFLSIVSNVATVKGARLEILDGLELNREIVEPGLVGPR